MKKVLLKFVRRFYNPNLTYADKLLEEWEKKSVRFIIDIIINGLVFYLVLIGLSTVFIGLSDKIYLGKTYWEIPLIIILLGVTIWFFESVLKTWRKK